VAGPPRQLAHVARPPTCTLATEVKGWQRGSNLAPLAWEARPFTNAPCTITFISNNPFEI